MDDQQPPFASIDEYIARFPKATQALLRTLRKAIKTNAPGAVEKISYQMPAFWLQGNLVYFAAYKNHIGFYPGAAGISNFAKAISAYKHAKGSVQFPVDKPLPLALVSKIVKFRVKQNLAKAGKRKKTPEKTPGKAGRKKRP